MPRQAVNANNLGNFSRRSKKSGRRMVAKIPETQTAFRQHLKRRDESVALLVGDSVKRKNLLELIGH